MKSPNLLATAAREYRAARDRRKGVTTPLGFIPERSADGDDVPAGQNRRASDLSAALRPLPTIEPMLRSRYLVKGWLDRGTFSVVYGESNVGKTFFALDLGLHVAAQMDWHGNRVADGSSGEVIYIAAEGGCGINNRIEAIRRDRPGLVEAVADSFSLLPVTLDLCGAGDAGALVDALIKARLYEPRLIVIDTLARSMGNGDENTAKDMGAFVRSVDLLRKETGAHVLTIHHSGKDTSKGARGSGSLRAAADTEIELTRSGVVIVAETRKQRDMPTGKVFAYTLRDVVIGHDEDGVEVTSAVVDPTEAPAKRAPRLKGQSLIAMQAFGDALADHGVKKTGEAFPSNRQCVPLDRWREYCDRHKLTDGDSDSAKRQAFGRAWKGLQERGLIRVLDDCAWRCGDD